VEETNKIRDPDATKKAILEAAELLFAQKGFAGTTIRKISEKSGCSGPLILFHFRSKKELYQAVKASIVKRHTANPEYLRNCEKKGLEHLKELIRALFNFYRENPTMIRIANWALLEGDNSPWLGEDALHHHYHATLTQAQEEGIIRKDIPPISLMAILCGAIHVWWEYREHFTEISEQEGYPLIEDDAFLEDFLAFAFQGLRPPEK